MTGINSIAWIGLGKLGLPMAARLAAAGHSVKGYDRDPTRAQEAQERQIAMRPSFDEAVKDVGAVFTSMPDDKALIGLVTGPAGLLAKLPKGTLFVDTSTVGAQASEEIAGAAAKRGVVYLRLPMSGNPVLAEAGTLTCFASGPKAAFEAIRPALTAFTRAQTWLGEKEEARFAKLAINLMIAVSAGMMAEALALARKGGIGWQDILNVMADSAVGSPFVKYKAPPLAQRDFSSTFSCRQMAKDLDLALAAGHQNDVPMPLAALMRETYTGLIGQGDGDIDMIMPVKQTEKLSGLGEP